VLDGLEAALVYHKVNLGIVGDCNYPPNTDLLCQARAFGAKIPTSFHQSVFESQLLRNDFRKYEKAYPWCPDLSALSLAEQALEIQYAPFLLSCTKTTEEALSQMDKTKSPGYPWNKKYQNKQKFIDNESVLIYDIIGLIEDDKPIVFEWEGRDYRDLYWMASPKGEFRPLEKLINSDPAKRKTRVFLAGETITHAINYRLYSNQNDKLLEAFRHNRWIQLGFTPFYGGWDKAARFLLNGKNPLLAKFDCWDAKHMEASVREQFFKRIYGIRDRGIIFEGKDFILRKFAYQQNCYSLVLDVDGYLIHLLGNNSSGGLNTLSDNCFAMELVILYTLAKKSSNLDDLMKKISQHNCLILGDDSVIPHHPDFCDLQSDAKELGFFLEPEALSVTIDGVVFCNNMFVYIDGMYLPKPNFEKIRTNIYFHFKKHSWRLAYIKVCAYRVLAWMFKEYRDEAEMLCRYILEKHGMEMVNEQNLDVSLHSARNAYLKPDQVDFMWRGNESFVEPFCKRTLDPFCPVDSESLTNLLNFALSL